MELVGAPNLNDAEKDDSNSEQSLHDLFEKIKNFSHATKSKESQPISIINQPSTSGLCNSLSTNKHKTTVRKMDKRKGNNSIILKDIPATKAKKRKLEAKSRNEAEEHYSPPVTRNYAKLTTKELNSLAVRIKTFHEEGVVVPEEKVDLIHCVFKKGKRKKDNSVKQLGEQVPGTHLGKGNIGANCSKFGISKCKCCRDQSPKSSSDIYQEEFLKSLDLNVQSCASYGIFNCSCCVKDKSLDKVEDTDIDVDHLSISQLQPKDSLTLDTEEVLNNQPLEGPVIAPVLPTTSLPKQKLIEKFLDSFTHDRVDYSKPQQKNIVEGLIHNPVSYYSEHLSEDVEAPEKTILERIDFQKEQERLSRLNQWANNPSTSTQEPNLTSGFQPVEFGATSTPQPLKFPVNCIGESENLSKNPPEKPVEPINNCDSNRLEVESSIAQADQITVKHEPLKEEPLDLSAIDRSFVTVRTPYKPRNPVRIQEECVRDEAAIMDYVNDLFAMDEEDIVRECQMRCKRVLETQQITRKVLASNLDAIEILDDDVLDGSIQIVDIPPIECISDGDRSEASVEIISDNRNLLCDSDIQIIEDPSSSTFPKPKIRTKKGTKLKKLQPAEACTSNLQIPTKDNGTSGTKNGIHDCSICLEPLSQVQEISSTTCGHIFCTACIKGVIKTNKKCPICRSHLTLKKIHPLFLF